jgi:hypothetical protein
MLRITQQKPHQEQKQKQKNRPITITEPLSNFGDGCKAK